MRSWVAAILAFAFVASLGFLGYAIYDNGYIQGYEIGYYLGHRSYSIPQPPQHIDNYGTETKYNCSQYSVGTQLATIDGQTIELKNPTFEELQAFIAKDSTNKNKWMTNAYECRHFASELCNNARDASLNCAFVLLCYNHGQHAVVAFDTVDKGLVYIEPQTDNIIYPEIGGRYEGKEIKEILIAW